MGVPWKNVLGIVGFPDPVDGSRAEDYRTDEKLIEFIEKFGSERASAKCSHLVVKEIPSGTKYRITEYDGLESIETIDGIDWKTAT